MYTDNKISIIHLFLRFTKQNLLNIKLCNCFLYDILQNNPQDNILGLQGTYNNLRFLVYS